MDGIIKNLPSLLGVLLVAILFIQSGLDKVFDWNGNVEWLKGHFSKTFLAPFVPLMLVKITILELLTGLTSAAGIVYFLATGKTTMIFCGASLGAISIVALFFGQRIAKDYAGAAVLIPYFILLGLMMTVTNPYR